MKTIVTANPVPTLSSLYVHGSFLAQAINALSGITKGKFETNPTFNIGVDKPCPALLYKTSSYERELEEFKKDHGHRFPLIDLEFVEINKVNYIAAYLKEEVKAERPAIKHLNNPISIRTVFHAPDLAGFTRHYGDVLKNNATFYKSYSYNTIGEHNFWALSTYNTVDKIWEFIDATKDIVPFDMEPIYVNNVLYLALFDKKVEVKEEPKKEEIFIGNHVNPKARLTLHELNTTDFSKGHLGMWGLGHSWSSLNFGSTTIEDREKFIEHHNDLGGKYEFKLHNCIVYYRERPEVEVKEEPKEESKTEVVVQPASVCPHQFVSVDSLESSYIANERATLADILAASKESVEDMDNTYDPEDEIRIYQLIGTVKRIVKIEENVTAIETNPLADAANPLAEQPKTNGELASTHSDAYSEENQEKAYQQYAGGF